MLPNMKVNAPRTKRQEIAFGGYDHNAVPREGNLFDMTNLSGECAPALSPRRGRTLVHTLSKPNGMFGHGKNKLCWVDGTAFYYGGVQKGTMTDGKKRFAELGPYVVIFPDKVYYHAATDTFGSLEASWTGSATITHHVYDAQGQAAETVYQGNAITTSGAAFPFEAGEAVFLSGSTVSANNRASVIREILDGGKKLVFSNNTFTEQAAQTLTMERKIPDMEYFCENENRLWGCKGNEIYASALGNPKRWNNLEGLATDSYAVTSGSSGSFTGAYAFLGYAIFFKEDAIHKVYGSKPSNFQLMSSAVGGVTEGAAGSLGIAAETLFYLARNGMTSYTGGIPTSLAAPFGEVSYASACGGSDGTRYYVCLRRTGDTAGTMFCYDPRQGLWHKEDTVDAQWFARADGVLYFLCGDGKLYSVNTEDCSAVEWMAETGDYTDGGADKAGVMRLQLRLELDAGSTASVAVQFDSDGVWRPVKSLASGAKRSYILPFIPRRCDHYRIRITGKGGCRVFSLTRESCSASAL